jgi:deoxyhypusine monooxygenase
MAPSATSSSTTTASVDPTIAALRKTLTTETEPLARRFRALFSLKHLACQKGETDQPKAIQAIESIAAGFATDSSLLGHELAYVLGYVVSAMPRCFYRFGHFCISQTNVLF